MNAPAADCVLLDVGGVGSGGRLRRAPPSAPGHAHHRANHRRRPVPGRDPLVSGNSARNQRATLSTAHTLGFAVQPRPRPAAAPDETDPETGTLFVDRDPRPFRDWLLYLRTSTPTAYARAQTRPIFARRGSGRDQPSRPVAPDGWGGPAAARRARAIFLRARKPPAPGARGPLLLRPRGRPPPPGVWTPAGVSTRSPAHPLAPFRANGRRSSWTARTRSATSSPRCPR